MNDEYRIFVGKWPNQVRDIYLRQRILELQQIASNFIKDFNVDVPGNHLAWAIIVLWYGE